MEMTLDIDDALMKRLREEAARRKTSLSDIVEAGLRRILTERPPIATPPEIPPPLPSWHGGELLVDITDRDEFYRVMEEE